MTRAFRIALASATMVAGLAVAGARPAQAQVEFHGSIPLPHGRLVIGHPSFRIGRSVPFGYRVYSRPGYGYGFLYRSRWIPVRRYTDSWVVCESPEYAYGYDGGYDSGYDGGYDGGYAGDYAYDPGYVAYGPRYSYTPRYYAPGPRVRVFSRDRFDRFDRSDFRDGGRGWDRGREGARGRDNRGREGGRRNQDGDRGRDQNRGGRWNR